MRTELAFCSGKAAAPAAENGGMARNYPVLVRTTLLRCVECEREWETASERWRLKVLFDEQPTMSAVYCPDCHAREFGD